MITLLILGVFLIIVGFLIILAPQVLLKISHLCNRKLFDDNAVFSHRAAVAIICIATGAVVILKFFSVHM